MCFSSGGGDPSAGARAEEAARQSRIKGGMSQVDAVFQGGRYGTGAANSYQAGTKYYNPDGTEWNPNPSGFQQARRSTVPNARPDTYEQFLPDNWQQTAFTQQSANSPLYTGFGESKGFGEDFFNERANAYRDYALPQVDDQFKRTYDSLIANLSRSGNLRSSAGARNLGLLQRELGTAKQRVADQGLTLSNELRGEVERNRSEVVNQLQSTGDSQVAANSALARASLMRQPTSYEPLGDMFGNVTNAMALNQIARAYDPSVKSIVPNLKLFGGGSSSRVVR